MNRNVQRLSKLLLQQQQSAKYSASPLAGRNFLPGAEARTFPKFLPLNPHYDFPHIFKARNVNHDDLVKFAANFRPMLDRLIEDHGAVLVRGAQIDDAENFSKFAHALNYKMMRNINGLGEKRLELAKHVYSSRSDPPELNIEPHQELSYLPEYPHLFFVHCEGPVASDCGGDYILVEARDVLRELDSSVVDRFRALGVRYYRQLPCVSTEGKPCWRQVMCTMSRDVAETRLKRNGFMVEWANDGTLHYWIDRPALTKHYRTGEEIWFNQAHAQHWTFHSNHPSYFLMNLPEKQSPSNTFYGDGSPIEIDIIQHIRETTWRNAHGVKLRRGDVLIMDNLLIQHGRLAYAGARNVSVAMATYE